MRPRSLVGIALATAAALAAAPRPVALVAPVDAPPRVQFGLDRLSDSLRHAGFVPSRLQPARRSGDVIVFQSVPAIAHEGFELHSAGPRTIEVRASDPSGFLYGALALAGRVRAGRTLPANLDVKETPAFKLRGPCIGMQKTDLTYDNAPYDYRYTPEEFPFFYDKTRWSRYLDFLLENRFNTLYLWNGHPFTSLLKLPKYPDAQELTDAQLERNVELFRWLTSEADRRGIWVIQGFYNIHISHALAKARKIPFQHSTPNALVSEYTRYCISEFIRSYPNAGLLMTLGEALAPRHGPEWLSKTIIPGVKDGLRQLAGAAEPPIIVRAHATDIDNVIPQARPLYGNIYTMHKWNGESLTWTDVRGPVREMHEKLVKLGSTHIANVHLLANLEPFRWGSPEFVRETMLSCRRLGIRGLHLYPLRYWEWPVTADNAAPRIEQIERDWIWFEAWARYAWNPDRDPAAERQYWAARIGEKFGSREAGEKLLDAYQSAGPCQPRLLPRIGITEGNRQAFSLGMLMTQIIDPERYNAFQYLWTGDAPPGERLPEWVGKEWNRQPHEGETPLDIAEESVAAATRALALAEAAGPYVTANRDEYERLANDMRALVLLMRFYRAKSRAAALVLRYGYSKDAADLRRALALVEESLAEYRKLVTLTDRTYREACSIHSLFRRIPFLGAPGKYTHWRDVLPEYEKELAVFRGNLTKLESGPGTRSHGAYPAVAVKVTGAGQAFVVKPGESLFSDRNLPMAELAPELHGLTGIRIDRAQAVDRGVSLKFELAEPAQVLVGFFRGRRGEAAEPPRDEWNPVLRDGVIVPGHPRLTVYAHQLPPGANDLDLGKGAYVVLGFVRRDADLQPRIVFFSDAAGSRANLDWLFE